MTNRSRLTTAFSVPAIRLQTLVRSRTAALVAILAINVLGISAPITANAVHDAGIFELDGNVVHNGTATYDWGNGIDGTGGIFDASGNETAAAAADPQVKAAGFFDHNDTNTPDNAFTEGGSKDIYGINKWKCVATPVTGKDEMYNAYATLLQPTTGNKAGHFLFYMGLERAIVNGTADAGFWLLQNGAACPSGTGTQSFTGGHVNGDILIFSTFTGGGGQANVSLYTWVGDDATGHLSAATTGADCANAGSADNLCGIANSTTIATPWPTGGVAGTPGSIPSPGFYEAGVDLTAFLALTPNNPLPCFSNFLADTRSSASVDAQLKDFVGGRFNTCNTPHLTTSINGNGTTTISSGDSVTDSASMTGAASTAGGTVTYKVYTGTGCDNAGNPTGTQVLSYNGTGSSTVVVTNGVIPASASFTPSAPGSYQFIASYSGDLATGGRDMPARSACGSEPLTVNPPSLTLTKTPDAAVVSAGDSIGFTITAHNSGPGIARAVTLSDTLPSGSGVSWSMSPTNGACSITGTTTQTLNCSFGDMASGATQTVHLVSATNAASCGDYPNVASLSATNAPTLTATADTRVQCPGLNLTKTADAATVNAGDQIGFTITVSNSNAVGIGSAHGVTLTDVLPTGSGVSWSMSPNNGACTITGSPQTLNCNFGTLAPGASVSVHVVSGTAFASCKEYPNTASVSATNAPTLTASASTTVQCPNLSLTKTADAATVNAGDQIGFTITAHNDGPGIARAVTLHDPLPSGSGVSWSMSPNNGACTITGANPQTLNCSFGDMASGATVTVHVVSATIYASCQEYPNSASLYAGNAPSLQAIASTTVQCPSLSLSKTADKTVVNAGDPIGFTITAHNAGPGIARSVTLNDPLPSGLGVSWSMSPNNAACTVTGTTTQTLNCSFGDMASGATQTVHLVSATSFVSCGVYPNTASLSATNAPSLTANASITVQCPNLTLVKAADAPTVSAGSSIGFTITAHNAGPGTATGVTLGDVLPSGSGVNWSINPANGACTISGTTTQTLSCNFGDMASGASASVHVTSGTTFASCKEYPNTASLSATNAPTVTASASTTVLCPGLNILKTADAATVNAGDQIGFTITISNAQGAGTATGVTLTDVLPAGSGVSWSMSPNNGACTITGSPQTLNCSFGNLAGGSSASVHVVSGTAFVSCGTYPNTATASATNAPSVSADASTTVQCPNLSLTKTADSTVVNAGDAIGFTITAHNSGPGVARSVTLTDVLPSGSGVSWSMSPNNGACTITGTTTQTLNCSFGDMASGATQAVHLVSATAFASCKEYPNTASLSATNAPNLTASASITVQCPNLSLTKAADSTLVNAGDAIGFTITAHNAGPGVAHSVTLTDVLPSGSGVSWSMSPNNGACAITGTTTQTLNCSFGDMASGATQTVHLVSATSFVSCGAYPNTASLSATNAPSLTADASTTVQCPNLSLTKTADSTVVNAGDAIGFTITAHNAGPGVARSVTLTDVLPSGSGVSWSMSPNNGACTITGTTTQTLNCSFGDMASGATQTVHLVSATSAASCKEYPNTASLSATNAPSLTARASTTVQCPNLSLTKTADNAVVNAGDAIGFTITAHNAGPGVARSVTLTDILPTGSGVSWSMSPNNGACTITGTTTQTLNCSFGDMASGATQTVHVTSATAFVSCATYLNTASLSATNAPTLTADASTTVQCPNLSVTKTADAARVSAGGSIGFTITVNNAGPGTARSVTLSDSLPSGSGVSWSMSPNNGSCTITGTTIQTLNCSFGDMASGATITVHVISSTAFASCGTYDNVASAQATNHPTVTAGATTSVDCPNSSLTKGERDLGPNGTSNTSGAYVTSISNALSGDVLEYQLVYTNSGNGDAGNVTVTDVVPSGTSYITCVGASGFTCNQSAGTVTFNKALVAAHTTNLVVGTFRVRITATGAFTITNVAAVSTSVEAPKPSNIVTVVGPLSALVKAQRDVTHPDTSQNGGGFTAATIAAHPSDVIEYRLTYTNSGNGPATNVVITDAIPAHSTFLSCSNSCANTSTSVSWNLGTVPPGTVAVTFQVTLAGDFAPGTTTQITNVAVVTTTEQGNSPSNTVVAVVTVPVQQVLAIHVTLPKAGVGPTHPGSSAPGGWQPFGLRLLAALILAMICVVWQIRARRSEDQGA